jgi:hypothetical protein
MATSSIFASFDIRSKKTAENFVEALDKSANDSEWKPIVPVIPIITDKDDIRKLWTKRKQKK